MTKLYEAKNHVLIHGGRVVPAEHHHMAAHIIISFDGRIKAFVDGEEYLCHGVMIPSGAVHKVDTAGNDVLVFLYDCTAGIERRIRDVQCIPQEKCDRIIRVYRAFEQYAVAETYEALEKCMLALFDDDVPETPILDERMHAAMGYIRKMLPEEISCRDVANAVNLSQGRFSHLFRQQVGMTFASYRLYQRIMHVYAETIRGKSITEAACAAGFSSSSHFADVNRRVFGLPLRVFVRNLTFVRIQ